MFFIISVFIVYIIVHYYVLYKIAVVFQLHSTSYFILFFILFFLAVWGVSAQTFSDNIINSTFFRSFISYGYIWLGTLSILVTFLLLTDLSIIFIRNSKYIYLSTLASCILTVICSAVAVFNVYRGPIIKYIDLQVSNLPVDKITLVQLADMHIDAFTSYEEIHKIIDMTNSLNPDLVLLTGDIQERDLTNTYDDYKLDSIKSKYGIFAVSGNHEYYTGINRFHLLCGNIKTNIVHNDSILVNDILYIAGIPDMKTSDKFFDKADVKKALQGVDYSKPVIFLSHQPEAFFESSKYPITLQLSAHTHAGQIPPFDVIEYLFFKYFYGLYKENNSYLYVTSGTRWWGPPMRLFSRSEIVCITLHK